MPGYHHPRFWRPVWATPATISPAKWKAVGVDNTLLNPALDDLMRGKYSAIEVRLCNNQIVIVRRLDR